MNNPTITLNDLKKIGLRHTPDLDFRDDGTKFKMLTYKGLPVSYTKVDGQYYISIRFDYHEGLSYDTYSKFPSYKVTDEFNGVGSIDLDKLLLNLKYCRTDLLAWLEANN